MSKIKRVVARQVYDSRGNPTIEAEVFSNNLSASAICPSGASTGTFEAYEKRDKSNKKYLGKSVLIPVATVNRLISKKNITDKYIPETHFVYNFSWYFFSISKGVRKVEVYCQKLFNTASNFPWKEKYNYILNKSNHDRIAEALYKDLRKSNEEVITTEMTPVILTIKEVCKKLKHWMKDEHVPSPVTMVGMSSFIKYESKGNILIIGPWNYPFQLVIYPLVYAIAAGNTAIIKPFPTGTASCMAFPLCFTA